MSSAFGITGVSIAAIQVIRGLGDDLQRIKDAPHTIGRLSADAKSIEISLESLSTIDEAFLISLGPDILKNVKNTIRACEHSSERLKKDLIKYIPSSPDGTLKWHERAKVGFLKDGQIQSMLDQFEGCKASISSVVTIANFKGTRMSSERLEAEQKRTTMQLEQNALVLRNTQQELQALRSEVQDLGTTTAEASSSSSSHGDREVMFFLEQLQDTQRTFEASQDLLRELLQKLNEQASRSSSNNAAGGQYATHITNWGNNNRGLQAQNVYGGTYSFGGP